MNVCRKKTKSIALNLLLLLGIVSFLFVLPVHFSETGSTETLLVSAQGLADIPNPTPSTAEAPPSFWETTVGRTFSFAIGTIADAALRVIAFILEILLVPLTGILMTGAGLLLDHALLFTINAANYNIDAVDIGWRIFRDLANIGFIFLLLYIGIAMILGLKSINTKRLLVGVIAAALLINFSLLFTKIVIDIANLFAWFGYNLATQNGAFPISDSIRVGLSLVDLQKTALNPGTSSFIGAIAKIVIFSITAYALFSAALIFIIRTITFIFLMILAPIGFIGAFLPPLKKWTGKWWDSLVKQAIVAPIFLIFLYIIIQIMNSNALKVSTDALGKGTPTEANISFYFNFIVVIGLLLGSIKILKEFGGEFAGKATGFAKSALGFAAGTVALGGGALFARNVVGRGLSAVAGGRLGDKLAQKEEQGGWAGRAAGLARSGLKYGGRASYDFRALPGAEKFDVNKKLALGKAGGKGGFDAQLKRAAERKEKRSADLARSGPTQAESTTLESLWGSYILAAKAGNDVTAKTLKDSIDDLNKTIRLRGEGSRQQYAQTLTTESSIFTLWGRLIPRKDRAAATLIRRSKGDADKIVDAINSSASSSS